jgi:hypothetical protein
VPLEMLAEWIAMRTAINENVILLVLHELKAAILFFNGMGTPVKLPGLGRIAPSISYDGKLRINMKMDNSLRRAINRSDGFNGRIDNRANIGLDKAELKVRWDEAHPENLLEL